MLHSPRNINASQVQVCINPILKTFITANIILRIQDSLSELITLVKDQGKIIQQIQNDVQTTKVRIEF